MPSSPFLGLSVFVHLMIILAHRAFKWTERKTARVARELGVTVYFIGCIIIAVIFCMMMCMASVLVHISITDNHSNIALLQTAAPEISAGNIPAAYRLVSQRFSNTQVLRTTALGETYNIAFVLVLIGFLFTITNTNLQQTVYRLLKQYYNYLHKLLFSIGVFVILIGLMSIVLRLQ